MSYIFSNHKLIFVNDINIYFVLAFYLFIKLLNVKSIVLWLAAILFSKCISPPVRKSNAASQTKQNLEHIVEHLEGTGGRVFGAQVCRGQLHARANNTEPRLGRYHLVWLPIVITKTISYLDLIFRPSQVYIGTLKLASYGFSVSLISINCKVTHSSTESFLFPLCCWDVC